MEIRKRFSLLIKGKKNGRSKTNCSNDSDKIEEKTEGTKKTEKTEEKEIVVSLKKLKAEINGNTDINKKEVEIEGKKYKLSNIIDELKTDREKAKEILINWINTYHNIIKNDNNKLALIYCLETFAFRKDFRNEVKVKFGDASTQLQQKVIQFGNTKKIKCENLKQLHQKIQSDFHSIQNEIKELEAGKSAKARRASRKLLKKAILETNTIKHELTQKLKPYTEERTTTKEGNNAESGKVNLVLIQLSPKAQKEFDRLKTKVYGHGFIGARNRGENFFLSELKNLEHHDFGNLKVAIEKKKELTALIKYLKDNKDTVELPYTTEFLDNLIRTCEELEEQLKSSQTPEKKPLSGAGDFSLKEALSQNNGEGENSGNPKPEEATVVTEPITGEDSYVGQHPQQHGAGDSSSNGRQESSSAVQSSVNSQTGEDTSRVSARKNPAFEEIKKIYNEIIAIDIKELTLEKIKDTLNTLTDESNYLSDFIEIIIDDLGKPIELNEKYSLYLSDKEIKRMISEICDKAQKVAKIDNLMESVKTDLNRTKGEGCLDFGTLKICLSRVEEKLSESSIKDLLDTGKKLILTYLQTYLNAVIEELDGSKPLDADLPKVASYESISENGGQEIITILEELWEKAYNVSKVINEDSKILKNAMKIKTILRK